MSFPVLGLGGGMGMGGGGIGAGLGMGGGGMASGGGMSNGPVQFPIPYEAGSRIIGKAGATIKRLQATYHVKIEIPPKDAARPANGIIPLTITGQGQNVQSCWEDVQQSVLQSGSGMGGSGAGGGVKIGQAFVFRLRSDFELEMLLQYANVNGQPQNVSSGHAWVAVGLLQADPEASKDVTLWIRKNAATIIPEVLKCYNNHGMAQAKVSPEASRGASPLGSPGPPPTNWGQTPQGSMVLQNFWKMTRELAAFDEATFASAVQHCFHPNDLVKAFHLWLQANQTLPHDPASIPPM